jgi:hypothetical protein
MRLHETYAPFHQYGGAIIQSADKAAVPNTLLLDYDKYKTGAVATCMTVSMDGTVR